jgi:hypothetical protein
MGHSEQGVGINHRTILLRKGYESKSKKYSSVVNSGSRTPLHPLTGAVARLRGSSLRDRSRKSETGDDI